MEGEPLESADKRDITVEQAKGQEGSLKDVDGGDGQDHPPRQPIQDGQLHLPENPAQAGPTVVPSPLDACCPCASIKCLH
jgi:hypothetical protein